jgi:tetratricopeptide (TPR) repeat protein
MMRKTLTTVALGSLVVLATGCATDRTALDRGIAYYRDGNYLFAAERFTEAIRQNPTLPAAYVNRGVARARLGRLDAAIDDYNAAIALDASDPAIYFNRGNALAAAGHYRPAADDFTRALELSPAFAKAWFNRGSAWAMAGQTESALKDWLHAIELESDPWARAAMRRSAGLESGSALAMAGTPTMAGAPTTATTVAPPPVPGTASGSIGLPPPATIAATPPVSPSASPTSPESVDARALAIRAVSRQLDGDQEGALRDLRAALAVERNPARRQALEDLLRRLETPR